MKEKSPNEGQLMLTVNENTSIIFGNDDMRLTYLGNGKHGFNFLVVSKQPLNNTAINLGGKYASTIQVKRNDLFQLAINVSFFVSRLTASEHGVLVGVRAPREYPVHREKVFQRIQASA